MLMYDAKKCDSMLSLYDVRVVACPCRRALRSRREEVGTRRWVSEGEEGREREGQSGDGGRKGFDVPSQVSLALSRKSS